MIIRRGLLCNISDGGEVLYDGAVTGSDTEIFESFDGQRLRLDFKVSTNTGTFYGEIFAFSIGGISNNKVFSLVFSGGNFRFKISDTDKWTSSTLTLNDNDIISIIIKNKSSKLIDMYFRKNSVNFESVFNEEVSAKIIYKIRGHQTKNAKITIY